MKIGIIASVSERIPPKKYGGSERVIHGLVEELVHRGHDVTLFASGDSQTSAKLVSVVPRSLRESKHNDPYGVNNPMLLNIGLAYSRNVEFDIIHDHTPPFGLPVANISPIPVVATMHGAFNPDNRRLFETLNRPYIVTISKAQGQAVPGLNHAGTVYNGLNMKNYPFSREHDGYLLFVGRISMEKGVHRAIEVAQFLDLPLIIAAKLDPADKAYYKEYIEPRLSEQIQWIGEVDEQERNHLMSRAMAFLHPITWPEPFGLVMIEAMACGCPVIGMNLGSVPEIIKHGKTGFVANNINEMIEYVGMIDKIDRDKCRRYSLANFGVQKMTDGYEAIYNKILSHHGYKTNGHHLTNGRSIASI